jgi:hypothetical protein
VVGLRQADEMPHEPQCKIITDSLTLLESLVEKHMTQHQVLRKQTHARPELRNDELPRLHQVGTSTATDDHERPRTWTRG